VSGRRGASLAVATLVATLALVLGACGGGEDLDLSGTDDSLVPAASITTPSTGGSTPGSSTSAPTTSTSVSDDGEVEVSSGLPDGWPDDLPTPDGAVVELGQRTEGDDGLVLLTVDYTVEDGGANVYTAFLRALEQDSGTTILQRSSGDTEAGFVGSISFEREDYSGNVAVDTATGGTILTLSVVLT
jgi:hypothetical protein